MKVSVPLVPRWYQREAVDSVYGYWEQHAGHCVVVLPTASGKSLAIALLLQEIHDADPAARMIVLTHVKELIAQNFQELIGLWPEAPAGIYSASLGQRNIGARILFAGIQSIHRKVEHLQAVDIIVIDEAHLIPFKDQTMYRRFIAALLMMNPALKVVGFTATDYRLDGGRLHEGEGALFDGVAYEADIKRLIADGYLAPVRSPGVTTRLDVSGVKRQGGDFVQHMLEAAVDKEAVTRAAVREIIEHGEGRNSWIVFGAGVSHCRHICEYLQEAGVNAACIFGDTPQAERDALINAFKAGGPNGIKCLVSMNVLTTGFNARAVDLIAGLRPTDSTSLYVQMVGRGMRLSPETGKTNCIAEGQRVLTDRGLVPIEAVTLDMCVWDGVEFVEHCGAVLRGEQEVITYAGLTATPDHRVWTEEGWRALGDCAVARAPILVTGDGRAAIRATENRYRRDHQEGGKGQGSRPDGMRDMRHSGAEGFDQCEEADGRLSIMREPEIGPEMAGDALQCSSATLREPEGHGVSPLWGPGDRVQIPVTDSDGCVDHGEPWASSRDGDRSGGQSRSLRAGKFALDDARAKSIEHPEEARQRSDAPIPNGSSRDQICGRNPSGDVLPRHDRGGDRRSVSQEVGQTKRRVWDILNAGPRHRFTVEGVMVHNCLYLDFAGNVMRHGPIDMVRVKVKKGDGTGDAPAKECPECGELVAISVGICPNCGYAFPPPKTKLDRSASQAPVISTDEPWFVPVSAVTYKRHVKGENSFRGAQPGGQASLQVTYQSGLNEIREWMMIEMPETTMRGAQARSWWKTASGGAPFPGSVAEAIAMNLENYLTPPTEIRVRMDGKFLEVVGRKF